MKREEGLNLVLLLSSRYVLYLEVILAALLIDLDTRPSHEGNMGKIKNISYWMFGFPT